MMTSSPIVPWELQSILLDMDRALKARLYYPAILIALTIPEICSALALAKNVFVKSKHYVAFVDAYTSPSELGCDGAICYRLRGGVVHRANLTGHHEIGYSHILFTVPETGAVMHAFSMKSGRKTAMVFDVIMFCVAMDRAARKWFHDNKTNPLVAENLPLLIRFCPEGLHPFFVGSPLVASGV